MSKPLIQLRGITRHYQMGEHVVRALTHALVLLQERDTKAAVRESLRAIQAARAESACTISSIAVGTAASSTAPLVGLTLVV